MAIVVCFLAFIVWIVWPEKQQSHAKTRTVHTCKHPPVYRNGVAYRACGCRIYTKDSDGI